MNRNLLLSAVNVLVISIPFGLTWGMEGYLFACAAQILLVSLLFWNVVGDAILAFFIFQGKAIPANAEMRPVIERYMNYLISTHVLEGPGSKILLWADSIQPYFIPISKRTFIVSISLQDELIQQGEQLLRTHVPSDVYSAGQISSRKILLLTVFGYIVTLRLLELWAVIFAVAVKIMMSIVMLITTGALFGTAKEAGDATSLGVVLGNLGLKGNDAVNYLQDYFTEWLVRETVLGHFQAATSDMPVIR